MANQLEFKYRAFLSYAHADSRPAVALHRHLETFRIDKALVGRTTGRGPVPTSLRPIFRDRDDFTGGNTLKEATIMALDASAALIVVCSPTAATRPAVNEEVRLFKLRHPDRPIIPVIVAGEAPANFPPALRYLVDAEGNVTDVPVTILACDMRENGDGPTLGLSKVVAGLTGVGTDDIVRRAVRDQRRRMRNWVAGLGAVAVSLGGISVWAEINRREAVEQRQIAQEQRQIADQRRQQAEQNLALARTTATALVTDIADGLRFIRGMSVSAVQRILQRASATYDKISESAPDEFELLLDKANAQIAFAETYYSTGDFESVLSSANSALAILDGLLAKTPDDTRLWTARAMGLRHIAIVHGFRGNLQLATTYLLEMRQIYQSRLQNINSVALGAEYGTLLTILGTTMVRQGDVAAGNAMMDEGLAAISAAGDISGLNAELRAVIGGAYYMKGVASGGNDEASRKYFEAGIEAGRSAYREFPDHAVVGQTLGFNLGGLGYNHLRSGRAEQALPLFEEAIEVGRRAFRADEANLAVALPLADAQAGLAETFFALRRLPEAHTAYITSVELQRQLLTLSKGEWTRRIMLARQLTVLARLEWETKQPDAGFPTVLEALATLADIAKTAPPEKLQWRGNVLQTLGLAESLVRIAGGARTEEASEHIATIRSTFAEAK